MHVTINISINSFVISLGVQFSASNTPSNHLLTLFPVSSAQRPKSFASRTLRRPEPRSPPRRVSWGRIATKLLSPGEKEGAKTRRYRTTASRPPRREHSPCNDSTRPRSCSFSNAGCSRSLKPPTPPHPAPKGTHQDPQPRSARSSLGALSVPPRRRPAPRSRPVRAGGRREAGPPLADGSRPPALPQRHTVPARLCPEGPAAKLTGEVYQMAFLFVCFGEKNDEKLRRNDEK